MVVEVTVAGADAVDVVVVVKAADEDAVEVAACVSAPAALGELVPVLSWAGSTCVFWLQ